MIKNIIFDMGNVLLRYDPEFIAENIFEDKLISKEVCNLISNSPQWRLLDEGKISDEQAILQLIEKHSNYKNEIYKYMENWAMLNTDRIQRFAMHEKNNRIFNHI